MLNKPYAYYKAKIRAVSVFLLSVFLLFNIITVSQVSFISAAELSVVDKVGSPYAISEAPAGASFSIDIKTSVNSNGTIVLSKDGLTVAEKTISHDDKNSGVSFSGVDAGVYTLGLSSSNIVVNEVQIFSSSQVLGTGNLESSSAAASESSSVSKSAYVVGAAAVAGVAAASAGTASIVSSGSSTGTSAARFGVGSAGGVRNVVTQPIIMLQPRNGNPSFDPNRPTDITVNPAPPIPLPTAAPTPTPEAPAQNPSGQPNVMPAPPVTNPMTPS